MSLSPGAAEKPPLDLLGGSLLVMGHKVEDKVIRMVPEPLDPRESNKVSRLDGGIEKIIYTYIYISFWETNIDPVRRWSLGMFQGPSSRQTLAPVLDKVSGHTDLQFLFSTRVVSITLLLNEVSEKDAKSETKVPKIRPEISSAFMAGREEFPLDFSH